MRSIVSRSINCICATEAERTDLLSTYKKSRIYNGNRAQVAEDINEVDRKSLDQLYMCYRG